jgi:hypothetical protein
MWVFRYLGSYDYFIKEKNSLDKFTKEQLITKLEEANGVLHSLRALKSPSYIPQYLTGTFS